jgi:HEAT repeat protein
MLNDPEPQVVFAVATTLWTDFKDHAGEDILVAVADGNRKASPGLLHGAKNDMARTMHSPAAMAKLGVQESAGLLLGPFGFSIAALEYMHKNGSDDARVKALNLLAEDKSETMRQEMVDALTDNDPGVRAAAAKALGELRLRGYATAISPLIDDPKLPVKLTAAAAYINCMNGAPAMAHPSH